MTPTTDPPPVSNQLLAAQQNVLAAVQKQVDEWNAVLKSGYLTTFDNWSQSVVIGRAPNTNPPQPPMGYAVGYFQDPTSGPGSIGPYGETIVKWAYPQPNGGPVCPMPPIPNMPGVVIHSAGTAMIGVHTFTDSGTGIQYFQCIPGDSIPTDPTTYLSVAFPGQSSDGVVGMFRKAHTPFGDYYQMVSKLPS